jgi:hypothetical protein
MDRYHIIRQRLTQLNLFETETDNPHQKRNEILSTKIYIIILTKTYHTSYYSHYIEIISSRSNTRSSYVNNHII